MTEPATHASRGPQTTATGIRLSQVRIRNFRGIDDITVDLGQETVLIGENNTGKTSVLQALHQCLRIRSSRTPTFDTYDLRFTDGTVGPTTAAPITITLSFKEDFPEQWSAEVVRSLTGLTTMDANDCNLLKIEFTGRPNPVDGSIEVSSPFLDEDDNPLSTTEARRPASLSTVQELAPIFYLAALRDAVSNFGAKGRFWRPFLNEGGIPDEKRQEIVDALQAVNDLVIAHHQTLGEVRDNLATLGQLIAMADAGNVSIDAVPPRIFDMLSRAQVSLTAPGGAAVPLERHGDGTQSLAVLLLFDAFLKAQLVRGARAHTQPILALEEPEAHLHPRAVRALYRVLQAIGGQKIISTHSGDLLAEVDIMDVRRLARRKGRIEVFQVPAGTLDEDALRKINHHVRRSRGELLFARCWLLVEGETEVTVLDAISRILGTPFDRHGVRIIEFTRSGLAPLISIADALGIPWHMVCDGDDEGQKFAKTAHSALKGRTPGSHITKWPDKNIEMVLCRSGYAAVYERAVPRATMHQKMKAGEWPAESEPNYLDAVLKATKDLKTACAHDVATEMEATGPGGIPAEFCSLVTSVLCLVEEK